MREIRNILTAFDQLVAAGECGVLASVVAVDGSTYRRPGARTLILADETTVGLVSGGCLESDLTLRAREVREHGETQLVHYDSSEESDIIWGLGLGCAGSVDVLLERVDATRPGPLELVRECIGARQPGVIVTPLGSGDASASVLPERLSLAPDGRFNGSSASQSETRWIETEARKCLAAGTTSIRRHFCTADSADTADTSETANTANKIERRYLFEFLPPVVRLLIFGAGADAAPLAQFANSLGWDVIVIDKGGASARPKHFAQELRIVELDPKHARSSIQEIAPDIQLDERSAAVVMNHHYLDDREILAALLETPVRYIGLLGPRQRGDDLLADLRAEGSLAAKRDPERVFSPAGLDIGADSPEQIALAVAAEIQAVFGERRGGWLRDRRGPIHEPTAT